MNQEKWIPVVGYEGLYSVSNSGRIKSYVNKKYFLNGKILKNMKTKNGYLSVGLYRNKVGNIKKSY